MLLRPPAPRPARYPFLLVDRVLEWEYGKHAVGYKCVTINDNFFPGHFPQRAIMPGERRCAALPGSLGQRCRKQVGVPMPTHLGVVPPHHPTRRPAGVLQVEAMAQLGGIIMIDPSEAAQQNNFFFGGVDNLRWRKPVVPGDVLVRAPALLCRGGALEVRSWGRHPVLRFWPRHRILACHPPHRR